ncbi:GntR family transcriptional regulator [Arenimonas oryziterrae]|uniref:HTH gntR-type domain-containing protein n=1 Tax=Arenimonas oryziterrae DSM 21050 = YC6267 TaxID=1121015 RepID=A0A091BKJ8_9GAMM|nr:GntR family transcriptional regulator [Arenimonas oryziterrae]KFN44835.1 hypothetical protein N789_02125 [Arenimonas oryziterrae DSM 21050 = YC6267]
MIEQRQPLRRDVTTEVLERLLAGHLPVGRVNESELADDIGVSRTPLREALVVLEQRGLIDSAMGRGFLVRPLNREEAGELYPLLSVLEPFAFRLSADELRRQAPILRGILSDMAVAYSPDALLALSGEWSHVLVTACPNKKLRSMLEDLHRLAARYERATLERGFAVEAALGKHEAIVDALETGDVERACSLVAETWNDCLASLMQWLEPAPPMPVRKRRSLR